MLPQRPRLLIGLALLALFSACSATGVRVEFHEARARSFAAGAQATRTAVLRAFDGLGYEATPTGTNLIVARSPTEKRFFSLIGERQKWREVTVRLSAAPYWTRVDVESSLIHGSPGSSRAERRPDADEAWLALFFDRVRAAFAGG